MANDGNGSRLVHSNHVRNYDPLLAVIMAGQAVAVGIVQEVAHRPPNNVYTILVGSTRILFDRELSFKLWRSLLNWLASRSSGA